MLSVHIFGTKDESITYVNRPGVYVVFQNDLNQVAFVRTPKGLFLPGGGKEGDESDHECISRECREELGWDIQIGRKITETGQFFSFPAPQQYYYIHGTYYHGTSYSKNHIPIEDNLHLEWHLPREAMSQMVPEAQCWVIQSYFYND